eukprot:9265214-Pyramimonas_sp.AAC.1
MPKGTDWTDVEYAAARQVFYDVMELDSPGISPMAEDQNWASARASAASGAPAAPGAPAER